MALRLKRIDYDTVLIPFPPIPSPDWYMELLQQVGAPPMLRFPCLTINGVSYGSGNKLLLVGTAEGWLARAEDLGAATLAADTNSIFVLVVCLGQSGFRATYATRNVHDCESALSSAIGLPR